MDGTFLADPRWGPTGRQEGGFRWTVPGYRGRALEALHGLVPEPKEVLLLDEGHMHPRRPELTRRLVDLTRDWLAEEGCPLRRSGRALTVGAPDEAVLLVEPHLSPRNALAHLLLPEGELPTQRHEGAYVRIGDLFYLVGGRGNRAVEIFDPATGVWRSGSPPPIELHHFQAVAYDGRIYVLGAMTGGYPAEPPVPAVYIYDPAIDEWTVGPDVPEGRRRGGLEPSCMKG